MTTVVAAHAVGDMKTWLEGGEERKALFKGFCSSYRIFKHATKDQVCLVWNDVDLEKMRVMMERSRHRRPEGQAHRHRSHRDLHRG